MRVTSNNFPDQLNTQLQSLQFLLNRDQLRIASGQKVLAPSDDPTNFRRSIEAQSAQLRIQELRNAVIQTRTRAENNFDAASSLQTVISRASELAISASKIFTQAELDIMANEMNQLLEQTVALGNRQATDDQFLFGGTFLRPGDTDPVTLAAYVPFSVTRNAQGQITAVTYRGNEKVASVEIEAGATLAYNVIGSSVTGTPRGLFINGATNVFAQLITLRDQLFAGNTNAVTNPGVANLNLVQDNVAITIGTVSANLARLNIAEISHDQQLLIEEDGLSRAADADLAETVLHLQRTQTAYEAALQTGARVLDLSLLRFL